MLSYLQVEGTFQLYSPPFLLGYDRQASLASSDQSHLRNSTFLALFIIVQPPLSPPDPIMVCIFHSSGSYLRGVMGYRLPYFHLRTCGEFG